MDQALVICCENPGDSIFCIFGPKTYDEAVEIVENRVSYKIHKRDPPDWMRTKISKGECDECRLSLGNGSTLSLAKTDGLKDTERFDNVSKMMNAKFTIGSNHVPGLMLRGEDRLYAQSRSSIELGR